MKGAWELIPVGLIVAAAIYGAMHVGNLPERVAIHFNAKGEPDNWMDRKIAIWLAPGFALFFFIAISIAQVYLPQLPSIYLWKTLLVFLMANVQVATVLYGEGQLRSPLLGIAPALVLLVGYGIWQMVFAMMTQGKG
ncbi:DUF1648 domain-containing protein [bacterium]|nr:DUF1648 domain-containing protein [bacterium]